MQKNPFHLADDYARMLSVQPVSVLESGAPYRSGFHWSERHLQCIWFDPRYRPASFMLPGGESVSVLDPGEWNLEAGPDFLNAALLVQPGARQLRGDIEVHVRPSDWDAHKHSTDPAYNNIIAHVTWFGGSPPHSLPAHVCCLALAEPIMSNPCLSLDDIDLKAYPHAILPLTPRPCENLLGTDPEKAHALLAAAGQFRLRAKAARLKARIEQVGERHQVFYEEVMAALGYKHNQAPFRALARLLPVHSLADPREKVLARLLGAAGLLPQPEIASDDYSRSYIRALWDLWWKNPAETLPADITWHTASLRPQNSPTRRLAAAAALFSGITDILSDLDQINLTSAASWFEAVRGLFENRCNWPFWNQRLSFSSAVDADTHRQTTLLGASRIAAIITNVLIPFKAVEGTLPEGWADQLPPEDLSAPMRLTANHLFGRDHNPALYNGNGLLQQGLLQIHTDFCLNAKPGCEDCPLCSALRDSC